MAFCPAAYMEIQLSSLGFTTEINFASCNGKVNVNFTADIGDFLQPHHTVPCHHSTSVERKVKQSKLRRRNCRKEASRTDYVISDNKVCIKSDDDGSLP